MINKIIDINNLSISYRSSSSPAVRNICLSIFEKDIFGLLGPNGAGKTTTISHLCGLIKKKSGNVNIFGLDSENDIEKIKKIIGFVPQEIALYKELTAWENLSFFGKIYGLQNNVLNERINFYLNLFGFQTALKKKVNEFSGGMKRRLNLIAGLLHTPEILILDEPTVGVDVQSKGLILNNLKELNRNGMTIIYTSHDLEEAQLLCNRIAIMDSGKILCEGETSELTFKYSYNNSLETVFLNLTGRSVRD